MTKIKLSALACAILVGGQQLVAEDLNSIIELVNRQSVNINNETKTITGDDPFGVSINVDNNGTLISRVSQFRIRSDINIKNNSNAIFENEVVMQNPHLHIINNSTAVFNDTLYISDDSDYWPIIEQDNVFSGGNLSLYNSTLDVKGIATFNHADVLINHGSTATIDNLVGTNSKIYVVNDSKLKINTNALFAEETHLIVKDDSNTTINGALDVYGSGTIEFVNGEFVVNDGGIKIDKSNLDVEGEVYFDNSVAELNNSSNANFKDKLTLFDSAMLLKNSSTLNVGGVADFEDSALVVQNGSKVTFGNNFTMKNKENGANVIEQDNDFSGGGLSLDNNSTLDIKKEAEFTTSFSPI